MVKGLYQLQESSKAALVEASQPNKGNQYQLSNYDILHKRFGHPSIQVLKTLFPSIKTPYPLPLCEVCEYSKHKKITYPSSQFRKSYPFQLIHSDVWGPIQEESIHGHRWFIVLIDDCSRFTWVLLMRNKSEVSYIIPYFCKYIHKQFETKIKGFRTDNARDYDNHVINDFFKGEGIVHETSCVYTPQQNGISERNIGHISEKTRALLIDSKVPIWLWGEVVLTSTQLINQLPTHVCGNESPLTKLQSFFSNVTLKNNLILRVFGCVCFVHNNNPESKFDSKAIKCIF